MPNRHGPSQTSGAFYRQLGPRTGSKHVCHPLNIECQSHQLLGHFIVIWHTDRWISEG